MTSWASYPSTLRIVITAPSGVTSWTPSGLAVSVISVPVCGQIERTRADRPSSSGRNRLSNVDDPGQSWRRASGAAFQVFIQDYYNARLTGAGIAMRSLSGEKDETDTLASMGLLGASRPAKIDLIVERGNDIIGVLFVKASTAERIMGDSDASESVMRTAH